MFTFAECSAIVDSMNIDISKTEAIGMFRNKAHLAKALGLTRQAIDRWADDKPIPQKHALAIRFILRPELFEDSK